MRKNELRELESNFSPLGSLDLQATCLIGDAVWLSERKLFEIIDDTRENFGQENFENIDPVASILDYILQHSRNFIEELTGYDFRNDLSTNTTEIYTYGNYMCSSYDYSSEAREELKIKIQNHLADLRQDRLCSYFLTELEIGLD